MSRESDKQLKVKSQPLHPVIRSCPMLHTDQPDTPPRATLMEENETSLDDLMGSGLFITLPPNWEQKA